MNKMLSTRPTLSNLPCSQSCCFALGRAKTNVEWKRGTVGNFKESCYANLMFKNGTRGCFTNMLMNIKKIKKNPTYGSQSISWPIWIVAPIPQYGGQRIPKNPFFLKNRKNHPKRKNSKTSRDMPILEIYPLTRGL